MIGASIFGANMVQAAEQQHLQKQREASPMLKHWISYPMI